MSLNCNQQLYRMLNYNYFYLLYVLFCLLMKEVSYEPEIETLPPDLPADLECVLLTVPLSCNGELMAHKSGGGNTGIIDNSEYQSNHSIGLI